MFPRAHMACSVMWAWGDANRELNTRLAPPPTTALVCSDVPEAMLLRAQADSNWIRLNQFCPRRTQILESNPDYVVCGWLFFPRKQFPCHLSTLELAFQIVTVCALTISSTDQFVVPWLLWFSYSGEVASLGNELIFILFSIWSSFLDFLSSTLTSIQHCLISVLSFSLFLNLLMGAAGELAFSLMDMVMKQRKIATQLTQASPGASAEQTTSGLVVLKTSNKDHHKDCV